MNDNANQLAGNVLMTLIVFITLIIGLTGVLRSILAGFQIEPGNWDVLMLCIAFISFIIVGMV